MKVARVLAVAVLAAAGLVSGAPIKHSHPTHAAVAQHVLYNRQAAPSEWTKLERASPESPIEFTLALKQRNLDILDKWFWEVSDPRHKNYQDFKTIDEIRDLVSPAPEEAHKVQAWLKGAGVHLRGVKDHGDAMDVLTKVKHAEQLFNTEFYVFQHAKTGAKIVRQFGEYSIPMTMKPLIDMVTGVSAFPIPHLAVQRENASNDYGVIPATLDSLYSISSSHRALLKKAAVQTSQAVIEFEDQDFAPSDLAAFGQGLNLNIAPVPANQIIGPNDPTNPGVESTLDIEMVAGVNLGASNWFWLEGGNGWLYTFAVHFFGTASVPQVNSISYGWWEGDQCNSQIGGTECQQLGVDTTGYVQRVNTEFQKIGLRGISLISASGDSGANGRTDPDCSIPHLRPSFPASSPYITAVGATELTNTQNMATQPSLCTSSGYQCVSTGSEQAVSYAISNFASGGGFSDIAAMPSYQVDAVNAYLNSGVALPAAGYFNQSGRAFPDVAAVGHNLLIVQGGAPQPVGGTSASAPIFAAVISMLNVAQIEKTGKPLGFLNPFLYQMYAKNPNTFNDITIGDNKCTEQGCSDSCQGYLCAKGWDPVTGLGTPNYEAMLAYIQSGAHMAVKRQ